MSVKNNLYAYSNSHDFVELFIENGAQKVRKTFSTNLNRAKRNVAKQSNFSPILIGNTKITSAPVLKFTEYENSSVLEMPYIEGIAGPMIPVVATKPVATLVSNAFSTLIYYELSNSIEKHVPLSVFLNKIAKIRDCVDDIKFKKYLDLAECILKKLSDDLAFPIGPCHGDLTFSNFIFDPINGITLFDFLDTYIESPLQDISKLKQDYIYGWSFRKHSSFLQLKCNIHTRFNEPLAIRQIERIYPIQTKILTLVTLLRIMPYVKDDLTYKWLRDSVSKILSDF